MGYTHYWYVPKAVEKKDWSRAIDCIKDIVKRHGDILAFEYDQPKRKPVVSVKKGIRFNGRGDDGHETFAIFVVDDVRWDFCKTARKPYDQAVCECLLVLRAMVPGFRVSSDGFCGRLEDGAVPSAAWPVAIEAVKVYGLHYTAFVYNERAPYCDIGMELVEDGVEGVRRFDDDGYES